MSTIKTNLSIDAYSDIQMGDLIQLEKGETVIRGRVISHTAMNYRGVDGRTVEWYAEKNYTVHIIEKAKSKLPDEPKNGVVIRQPGKVPTYRYDNKWRYITLPESRYSWEEIVEYGGAEFEVLYEGRS